MFSCSCFGFSKLPSPVFVLPTSCYRLLSSVFGLPTSVFGLPPPIFQHLPRKQPNEIRISDLVLRISPVSLLPSPVFGPPSPHTSDASSTYLLILLFSAAIFKAAIAHSSPLLPYFPPDLSIACCSEFTVSNPKIKGISYDRFSSEMPYVTLSHT